MTKRERSGRKNPGLWRKAGLGDPSEETGDGAFRFDGGFAGGGLPKLFSWVEDPGRALQPVRLRNVHTVLPQQSPSSPAGTSMSHQPSSSYITASLSFCFALISHRPRTCRVKQATAQWLSVLPVGTTLSLFCLSPLNKGQKRNVPTFIERIVSCLQQYQPFRAFVSTCQT